MDQKIEKMDGSENASRKSTLLTLAVLPWASLLYDCCNITWQFIENHILPYLCAQIQYKRKDKDTIQSPLYINTTICNNLAGILQES